jgi:hypothetical protein
MFVRLCLYLLIAFTISFSQNQVNISGTILDNSSNKPINGASVKLLGRNLTSSTDANGIFTISSSSVQHFMPAHQSSMIRFLGNRAILLRKGIPEDIKISLYDLSGRQRAAVHAGKPQSGTEQIFRPDLRNGIYICNISSAKEKYSIKLLSSDNNIFKNYERIHLFGGIVHGTGAHSLSTGATAIDTLLVTKNGYFPIKVPLDTLIKDGLKILLTDSSTAGEATIVPDTSWTCFMPGGIPPPELGEAVFSITLQYSAIHDVGNTKFGHRRQFDISGGTVTGSKITASVLTGGLDYELTLSTGSIELEQIDILKAGSTPILMRNAGIAPAGAKSVRVVLDFEAPNSSSYAWLNTGKFAANRIVDSLAKTIKLDVYDISKVALPATRIQIKDPAGVPNQTWDCLKWSGTQGATVFTENCLLGSSISIGASKRGSRNIIPITGGTTSGKVVGKILAGGADFQLSGIDARYTLAPNDGEFIIVRNCGSGALVPVFEARVDGPYAFLNENKYLSSQPGMGSGGVTITFYERK